MTRIVDGWLAVGDEIGAALRETPGPSDARIRKWVAALGRTQWTLVMRMGDAVWAADRERGVPAPTAAAVHSFYRRGVRVAFRDPVELADLAVDGDDLRAVGVSNGPAMGQMLARLLEIVVEDPSRNQRDVLLALVKAWVA